MVGTICTPASRISWIILFSPTGRAGLACLSMSAISAADAMEPFTSYWSTTGMPARAHSESAPAIRRPSSSSVKRKVLTKMKRAERIFSYRRVNPSTPFTRSPTLLPVVIDDSVPSSISLCKESSRCHSRTSVPRIASLPAGVNTVQDPR